MWTQLYSTTDYKIWKKTLFGKPKSYDLIRRNEIK